MELHHLTTRQKTLFDLIAQSPLSNDFYFTGGTALSSIYLGHRLSEDLDFFSQNEVNPNDVLATINSFQSIVGFASIDTQTSYNRNLFFLKFADNEMLKLEFTYFPFELIDSGPKYKNLRIDSLTDISANKLHAMSVKPRSRDYIDLYFIHQHKPFKINELLTLMRQKFESYYVDTLQLGSNLAAFESSDVAMIKKPIPEEKIRLFFNELAKEVGSPILQND